jgi:nucleotide-binding universal stress UspA family protein
MSGSRHFFAHLATFAYTRMSGGFIGVRQDQGMGPGRHRAAVICGTIFAYTPRKEMAKDIVLATDGSIYSQQAARFIAEGGLLPKGGSVHVVHVSISLPPHVTRYLEAQAVQDWYDEEAAKAIDPTVAVLREAGVPFVTKSLAGAAAQEIVQYADSVDAHMIVMGAHGRGMLIDAVIGSVAGRVLSLSSRPVLLVR